MVGAVGGAVIGGAADAAVLGMSLLAGTIVGGAGGGTLGYFSTDKLAEIQILKQPLGSQHLRCGPTKNLQFPFVLLNRARLHRELVAGRTHAQRGILEVDTSEQAAYGSIEPLNQSAKRELARQFDHIRITEPGSERRSIAIAHLTDTLAAVLKESLQDMNLPQDLT